MANTCMQTLYNQLNLRTQHCASCYYAAYSALLLLNPDGTWMAHLQELRDQDIQGPGKDNDKKSNSQFEPSWIWLVPFILAASEKEESEERFNKSMWCEWVKSKAWKEQWEEEVILIQEEM